jgi:hypothetical protein
VCPVAEQQQHTGRGLFSMKKTSRTQRHSTI